MKGKTARVLVWALTFSAAAMRGGMTTSAQWQPVAAAPFSMETKGVVVGATNQVAFHETLPVDAPTAGGLGASIP